MSSKGASGGILILFDKRMVEWVEEYIGDFTVACSLQTWKTVMGFCWILWFQHSFGEKTFVGGNDQASFSMGVTKLHRGRLQFNSLLE